MVCIGLDTAGAWQVGVAALTGFQVPSSGKRRPGSFVLLTSTTSRAIRIERVRARVVEALITPTDIMRLSGWSAVCASTAAASLCLATNARAQTIQGRVVDEMGIGVPHAEVQVLPTGTPVLATAKGDFTLGALTPGTYSVRVRHVGYEATTDRIIISAHPPRLTITLRHLAALLDTVHTTGLEARLPRMFLREQEHLGARLYGPELDSMFARGGSRNLLDMMTIDGRFASMIRRPHCLPVVAFVDGIQVQGNLQPDQGMGGSASTIRPLGQAGFGRAPKPPVTKEPPASLEMYISQKEIAAIEVFDSPAFLHEPFFDAGQSDVCQPIVFIWSKYYQQLPWAGH